MTSDLPAAEDAPPPEHYYLLLQLLAAIVRMQPTWLGDNAALYAQLQTLWRHPGHTYRLQHAADQGPGERLESALLAQCLLSYVDAHHAELPTLFSLTAICSQPVYCNSYFLVNYCQVRTLPLVHPAAGAAAERTLLVLVRLPCRHRRLYLQRHIYLCTVWGMHLFCILCSPPHCALCS